MLLSKAMDSIFHFSISLSAGAYFLSTRLIRVLKTRQDTTSPTSYSREDDSNKFLKYKAFTQTECLYMLCINVL